MRPMWPCKRFDFSWEDWRFALRACLAPPPREALERRLERRWAPGGHALVCLTVRSAFDLFLRAQRWPAGDEIVFSALTVPDMPELARHHGLRPVALDIHPLTARWDDRELEARIGPRTRAVVLTHLFGARADVGPAVTAARRRSVAVVEDCAQAYAGPNWNGHPQADLSLFSFGPMKTATAFGGALARIRDASLAQAMRQLMRRDPLQPAGEYLRRLCAYGLLTAATRPELFGALNAVWEALGADTSDWTQRFTRSVPAKHRVPYIRRRPCAAVLAVLERRLREGDAPVERRRAPGAALLAALGPHVPVPTRNEMQNGIAGRGFRDEHRVARPAETVAAGGAPKKAYSERQHGYWMVPVLTDDRAALRRWLRAAGFDALVHGRFQPVADGHTPTPGAERLADAVYLAFDPSMPLAELRREGALTARLLGRRVVGGAGDRTPHRFAASLGKS